MFAPSPRGSASQDKNESKDGRHHRQLNKTEHYTSSQKEAKRSLSRFSESRFSQKNKTQYEPSRFAIDKIASNIGKLCQDLCDDRDEIEEAKRPASRSPIRRTQDSVEETKESPPKNQRTFLEKVRSKHRKTQDITSSSE